MDEIVGLVSPCSPSGGYDIADGPDQESVEPDAEIDMEQMLPWVLPVEVTGPASFNLMGVWADNSSAFRPVTAAIRKYADWLSGGASVVAGDFNNIASGTTRGTTNEITR